VISTEVVNPNSEICRNKKNKALMIIMMIVKDEIVPFIADVENRMSLGRHSKSYLGTLTLLGHCT
jgi:hypothetical protein